MYKKTTFFVVAMTYNKMVQNYFDKHQIMIGDVISIVRGSETYEGILMPRIESGDPSCIVIKLDNGYNIAIRYDESVSIEKKQHSNQKKVSDNKDEIKQNEHLPSVTILHTGGTIASKVDYKTGGVYPAFTAEDLIKSTPELLNIANVSGKVISNIFSEDISPGDWKNMAKSVVNAFSSGAEGVVITHGTDTMGYSAAALSFMLKEIPGPVVFVGAQRSSDRGSSDAAMNLVAAVDVAGNADFSNVCVVMHKESSDTVCQIHPGTRVRKNHTSRRDAFRTLDAIPFGQIENGNVKLFRNDLSKRNKGKIDLDTKLDENVILLKIHPGIKSDFVRSLQHYYKGVILEGTGLGHVPSHSVSEYSQPLFDALSEIIQAGVHVCMTSQCMWGRVNMNVYSTGRELLNIGIIPLEDMLPETALVKLMWVLGHTSDPEKVKELMCTNLAGELDTRTQYNTFLR